MMARVTFPTAEKTMMIATQILKEEL